MSRPFHHRRKQEKVKEKVKATLFSGASATYLYSSRKNEQRKKIERRDGTTGLIDAATGAGAAKNVIIFTRDVS